MMKQYVKRFRTGAEGGSAVEFAIVTFPLLLFIFGTIEFGRLMWTREALQQTAISGARCMGMTQTACGTAGVYSAAMTSNYIQAQAALWSIPLTSSNMTLNASTSCGGVAGFSQVSLNYRFNTAVPLLITALAAGANLSAIACFPNHT